MNVRWYFWLALAVALVSAFISTVAVNVGLIASGSRAVQ